VRKATSSSASSRKSHRNGGLPDRIEGTEVPLAAIEALIFDVFGTCVDWRTGVAREVARVAEAKKLVLDPLAFADAWRGRYDPAMQKIRSGERGYVDLDVLHRENLDDTLAAFGLSDRFDEAEREALNHAWEKLPPWPDVVPGLARLREHHIIAPCSNGSIALMTRLAKFGGLPWDCILGAGVARAYKPDPRTYLSSCEALRLPPESVVMVAAHNDDLFAARAAGLRTGFVPRPTEHGGGQTTELKAEAEWDFVAVDIRGLAAQANS
jgi:2-haloacid dehalogenase